VIRFAIKLSLDAGDYERAAALLEVVKSKGSGEEHKRGGR